MSLKEIELEIRAEEEREWKESMRKRELRERNALSATRIVQTVASGMMFSKSSDDIIAEVRAILNEIDGVEED